MRRGLVWRIAGEISPGADTIAEAMPGRLIAMADFHNLKSFRLAAQKTGPCGPVRDSYLFHYHLHE